MARLSTSNVNPDLARERAKGTIDVEQLTYILYRGEIETQRRRKLEELALRDGVLADETDYHFLSRPEKYGDAIKKCASILHRIRETPSLSVWDYPDLSNTLMPNVDTPTGLHLGMFIPSITGQGSKEQQEYWMEKAIKFDIIGTYAQTELGHGTFVRGLETTATYDPRTEEFIIHSPTISATKWWPGGLGKTSNHAIVMAQLFTQGVCHGVYPFVVQLRDLTTHEPLPGITIGDIGPKFGYETMDNGFLRFDHFRIPRESMLMKNAQVQKDGTFSKAPKSDKLQYGAMVFVRATIVLNHSAKGLAKAATIAIRYSCVRRQSELKPGAPEPLILDYQTQQYKLLPQLATAYAFWFAGQKIWDIYFNQLDNPQSLPEVHALSAGLKGLTTRVSMGGIEQCRLACGGHGYSMASGIPKIYVLTTAACTYEGENTVMLLQTARFLMKSYQQAGQGQPLEGSVAYLATKTPTGIRIDERLDPKQLLEAYRSRARRIIAKAAARYSKLMAEGKTAYEAWNQSTVFQVKAAEAHCQLYVVDCFLEKIATIEDTTISHVLTQLFQLYAAYGISNQGADFLQDMTSSELDVINSGVLGLLSELRANAVALVDAFDFTDRLLGSILGRYDGNVYENMYNWAASSPLNKTQVHDSFKYIQELRKAQNQSKL